jgi:flagellin
MISGLGISSGIASAVRTASKARATMDTMARQIATGQRVASVKDDGAAWARANRALSDARARQALQDTLRNLAAGVSVYETSAAERLAVWDRMKGVALAATDPTLSAQSRSALQAEQTELNSAQLVLSATNHDDAVPMTSSAGGQWSPVNTAPTDLNLTWVRDINGSTGITAFTALTAITSTTNLSTATTAQTALTNLATRTDEVRGRVADLARLGRLLNRDAEQLRDHAGREEQLAASLTDADLGKASTARANAETRQQLALATVRQALDAYGTYAGGLLGNVQRTQRGIMA